MSPYKYEVADAGDPFGAYGHIYDSKNIPVNESLDFISVRFDAVICYRYES